MVKPGKKKVIEELSRKKLEPEGKRKNGAAVAAPDCDIEEKEQTGSNWNRDRDTNSSVSHSTAGSSKKPLNKRKVTQTQSRSTVRSGSDDSDDLPLNGSKESSAGGGGAGKRGAFAPKKRKLDKAKATTSHTSAAKNGKKAAPEDLVDDDELVNSDAQAGADVEYEVEAIMGHKIMRGASYFLVRWKGYNKDSDTWEPEIDLNCDDLIAQFLSKDIKTEAKSKAKPQKVVKKAMSGAGGRGRPKKAATPADPEKQWVVERIVDFADDLYRIRWKGFGAKDDTWEPESNLSCEGLIEKFKRDLVTQKNVDTKELRESPKKTKRLVNEYYPRTNIHNRIERSSKRTAAKNRCV
ncbi:M-phase phosphoprotein 8 isoform X2 [Drosophila gunungcola]|uniref:M-phase phosphoprotein 8 isoform X2 n=1 Tax=Drosophila gunungcola TaxID=103775 RepID=UPI0022E8B6EB|nr:M-phase phosphoprotein 8 isoform X2 [Drosophila gunungcola]